MTKLIKVKSGLEDPGKLANQYEFYEEFFKVFFEGLHFTTQKGRCISFQPLQSKQTYFSHFF